MKLENVFVQSFLDLPCCISLCVLIFWVVFFLPILHNPLYLLPFVIWCTFHVLYHFLLCFRCLKCSWFHQVFLFLKWANFIPTWINCTCVLNSFSIILNIFPLYTCSLCYLTLQFTEVIGLESRPLSLFYCSLPFPSQNLLTDPCPLLLFSSFL